MKRILQLIKWGANWQQLRYPIFFGFLIFNYDVQQLRDAKLYFNNSHIYHEDSPVQKLLRAFVIFLHKSNKFIV